GSFVAWRTFPLTPTLSPRRGGAPPLPSPHRLRLRICVAARVAPSAWGEYLFSVMGGTLSGFRFNGPPTQGSSFLATLGWRTQSLWDWKGAKHILYPKRGGAFACRHNIACRYRLRSAQ